VFNRLPASDALKRIDHLYEKSPWVVQRTLDRNRSQIIGSFYTFQNLAHLLSELRATFLSASKDERLGILRAHPDLVGALVATAALEHLTSSSRVEQTGAGLDRLTADEAQVFLRHNDEYKTKFGFPFIICVAFNKKEAIMEAMPRRLRNTVEQEFDEAVKQVNLIAEVRLRKVLLDDVAAKA